jgi:hypothetical protein
MKLRNIRTTLENLNEAIKYVVFVLTLFVIASIVLFFAQGYFVNGEIITAAILDVIFAIVILGFTISAKGSVSLRRTTLMILFGLFNVYGMTAYTFFNPLILSTLTDISGILQVFVFIGFVSSILNVVVLVLRAIFIVQYDICLNQGVEQLGKENFIRTFGQAVSALGTALPGLFNTGLIYQGFSLFLNFALIAFDYQVFDVESLVTGLIFLILPVAFLMFMKRKLVDQKQKSLGFAAFFGFIIFGCAVTMIVLSVVNPSSFVIYELCYSLVVSIIGFGLSIYNFILTKKDNHNIL